MGFGVAAWWALAGFGVGGLACGGVSVRDGAFLFLVTAAVGPPPLGVFNSSLAEVAPGLLARRACRSGWAAFQWSWGGAVS